MAVFPPSKPESTGDFEVLKARLAEAEEKLAEAQELIHAIQSGDVDAVVVSGPQGEQVFTLKGAEYAYRALVEAMSEGAATLDADGTVLYCNQHLSTLLGTPIEQIMGHPAAQLICDEDESFGLLFDRALAGDAAKAELALCTTDNRRIPVYVSLQKMKTEDPASVCMVVTDLTESRRWEELVTAGRLASSILESAAEAIAVCDEFGKIIRGNKALEELCGFNPLFQQIETVLPLHIVLGQASGAAARKFAISDIDRAAIPRGQEMSFQRKDGRKFYLLLSTGRIVGSSGAMGYVLTLTDVTNRNRVTQALIESEKVASVGRLASTIAHEINNPLEALGNALYLACMSEELPSQVRGFLDIASQELERVTHVTRQTLAFHRDTKTPIPINLCEVVEGVLKIFAGRLKTRDITVERRYATAEPIRGVSGELRQIVSNLISNSMDALREKGRLSCRVARSYGKGGLPAVRLTIADTGSGILLKDMKNIFEPFFTTKEYVGTGLGLWVTKEIVERHGATIRVRSKPGAGTAFSIAFPTLITNEKTLADE